MGVLTLYEQFTGYNWEKFSKIIGESCPLVCIGSGILAKAFPQTYNFTISMWAILVGMFLAIWEMPMLVVFIPKIDDIRTVFLDKFQIKRHLMRAILYWLLSLTLWKVRSFTLAAALYLDISAILYVFAYINQRSDAADGIRSTDTGEGEDDEEAKQSMLASTKFGTF